MDPANPGIVAVHLSGHTPVTTGCRILVVKIPAGHDFIPEVRTLQAVTA